MYIRSAEPTDAERIHEVSVASCRAAYEDVLEDDAFLEMVDDDSLVEPLRAKLAEAAADESLIYLVAQQDSSIVGFLQLLHHDRLPDHVDNDDAYLKSLYVHPTAWNEGIGTTLLEEGLDPAAATQAMALLEDGGPYTVERRAPEYGELCWHVRGSPDDLDMVETDS